MDFVDKTLVKLAERETRGALFDDASLGHVLAAAYDLDATAVEGPFQPVFDELRLGLALAAGGEIEGTWNVMGTVDRTEAKFYVSGLQPGLPLRVDGYWRGSIEGRTAAAVGRVADTGIAWPSLRGIDAEITAALGTLPSNPAVLEAERSTRLLARIRTQLDQPAAFTDGRFREWMRRQRAESAGELLARADAELRVGTMQVSFSPAEAVEPASRRLPIAGALLVRDVGFSLAQLLMESRMARAALKPTGLARSPDPSLKSRESLVVIWVVPETVFDDGDWPGGTPGMTPQALRAARRNAAGQWLAREGIALVATAP